MVFVKKRLILIGNIVLILAILVGIFFVMFKTSKMKPVATDTQSIVTEAPTQAPTQAELTEPPVIYTIGIIQRSDIPNCNHIYQGFIAELAAKGYVNEKTVNIDYVLEENTDKCKDAIQRFIDSDYDMIFTIGPLCTKLAASMTTEIPVVFAAVQEPEQEDYVESNEAPGGNVTGVSDYTPCFEQIDSIKTMFPDTKKIGAIYYATDAESVTQAIIGEKEAQTEEVNIPYEKYPVTDGELESTIQQMITDEVDVIYAPVDKYITKNIDTLLSYANENKIPVICGNTDMFDKGCFSTCVINYPSIGGAAADIALDILYTGAEPATTPIAYIYDCYLHINEKAMKTLGITLPNEVLETAVIE